MTAAVAATVPAGYRDLLTRRRVSRYFYGQAVSGFGDSLTPVALAFAVLSLAGSLATLAAALVVARLPSLLMLVFGGVAGDRGDPRRLTRNTAVAAGALNLGTAAALQFHEHVGGAAVALTIVIGIQFLAGIIGSFGAPAGGKLVRSYFTAPSDLAGAAALSRTLKSVAQVGAHAASGFFVMIGSPAVCFVINAGTFFVLVLCLPKAEITNDVSRLPAARRKTLGDIAAGWQAMRADEAFFGCVLANAVSWLLVIQPFLTITPILLEGAVGHRSSAVWGIVGACFGLGGVVAGAVTHRVVPSRPLTAAVALSLLDVPLMIQLAVDPGEPALYAWSLLSGLQSVASRIWMSQQLYVRYPADVTARVLSWLSVGWMFPSIAGAALVPLVVSAVGASSALWALTSVYAVCICLMSVAVLSAEKKPGRADDVA